MVRAFRRSRVLSVLIAIFCTAVIVDSTTYAVTGSSLILGKLNTAGTVTVIQNTGNGPALKLVSKLATSPALVTNSAGKVANLYAERADRANNATHATSADSATSAANANHSSTADHATSAGHASTADSATSAASATNASQLGGESLGQLKASVGQRPAQVLWVSPTGGDFTTLSAALASISDSEASKPYLIKMGPGTYAETGVLAMKDYVDVQGAGRELTTITCACSSLSAIPDTQGVALVLNGAVHSTVSDLTVINTGGSSYATAIAFLSNSANGRLRNVRAVALGGATATQAIAIYNTARATLDDVVATASNSGSTEVTGVLVIQSGASIDSLVASQTGSPGYGVNLATFSNVTIRNATISGAGSVGSDGSTGVIIASVLNSSTGALSGLRCVASINGSSLANLSSICT